MVNPWQKIHRRIDDTAESYERRTRLKPLSEMSAEELREVIRDPFGPDYQGAIDAARHQLRKRFPSP